MNEKELIVGKPSKKHRIMVLVIGIAFLVLFLVLYIFNVGGCRIMWYPIGWDSINDKPELGGFDTSIFDVMLADDSSYIIVSAALDIGIVLTIAGAIIFFSLTKIAITVTDKRVYGNSTWGRRVDLPLDSISAVALSALKGIAVATSSGTIKFKAIENNEEVHKTISDLLIERQGKAKTEATIKQEIYQSDADELVKFKELLDKGIITQEEYEAKKKQLLGL